MKITEVSVTISRTFNLGSYESARLEASASASLEDDTESPEAATKAMLPHLRKMLLAAYREHVDSKGKGIDL